ncbi:hypothetical protein C7S14_2767 [Burkholderia cepacia]|nr:hypothetical protein C7S14_2767 [Burkholderia cepacia]
MPVAADSIVLNFHVETMKLEKDSLDLASGRKARRDVRVWNPEFL